MNTIESIDPPGLATPNGFAHVTAVPALGMAFISGQVAYDSAGNVVGAGDYAEQTRQVFKNLETALAALGCDFRDVLKITIFVKGLDDDAIRAIRAERARFLPADRLPASTMVGVAALAKPALLLEVEAYVAIGQPRAALPK
jgi:enamine deaminase RidA (YjgF/YER057c/UK114 family)